MDFNIISLKGTLRGPSLLCPFRSLCPRKSEISQLGGSLGGYLLFWRSRPKPTVTSKFRSSPTRRGWSWWAMAIVGWVLELHPTPNQVSGWFLRFITMILKRKSNGQFRYITTVPKILNKSNNRLENRQFFPVVSRNLTVLCQFFHEIRRFFVSSFMKLDGS
jgi:hypothetical protein